MYLPYSQTIRVVLALAVCVLANPQAHAQSTFQSPVWGGNVFLSFNSTDGAAPGKYHTGIDYHGPNNKATYVLASNVGIVDSIVYNDGVNDHKMGNCVVLRHTVIVSSNGATATYYTLYAHLDSINVTACGQKVTRGQIIGVMGSTGNKKRDWWGPVPHLHFEVRTSGGISNPYGGGPFWGYTPNPAQNYGYINPANVIGSWTAK